MRLTDRDERIIAWVNELRFATREQIQMLLFTPHGSSACKRRLTLLYHSGFLDRRLIPLRSSFGANRAAYCLDHRGADLLMLQRKTGAADAVWRPRDNSPEFHFIEHHLAANDVRIAVTLAAEQQSLGLEWTEERTLRSVEMRARVLDPKHPGRHLSVVPDGYFTLEVDGARLGFALELDRGTVEERPFKEKVRALREWRRSGVQAERFGDGRFRVLFVVAPNTRDRNRLARIKGWTEAEGGKRLFWFADLSEVTPVAVLGNPIWQVASESGRFALLSG